MTIRMSSALLGASSLDSSSSFVEIDSDNTTSRSSSHEPLDDEPLGVIRRNNGAPCDDRSEGDVHGGTAGDSDDVDTKPNVSDFMAQSEQFLKNNFAAMGGLGLGPHHHQHHHHHHHHHAGLSAALHGYHHHHHPAAMPPLPVGAGGGGEGSTRNTLGPFGGSHHIGGGGGSSSSGTSKPPFMLPAQLYKSLFANAVLHNPDKMSAAASFPRNLLFSCAEKSPAESDGEVDDKASLLDEVGASG